MGEGRAVSLLDFEESHSGIQEHLNLLVLKTSLEIKQTEQNISTR